MRPIDQINSQPDRHQRIIQCRPLPQSGLDKYSDWLMCQDWSEIYELVTAHEKAEKFHSMLYSKLEEFLPEKTMKINSLDQPWFTPKQTSKQSIQQGKKVAKMDRT